MDNHKPQLNNLQDSRYNDECLLLDGLFEFHPDFFDQLSAKENAVLREYYLTGVKDLPENIFAYRAALLQKKPGLEQEANAVYQKTLRIAGIQQKNQD